jgi:hypothetical protein
VNARCNVDFVGRTNCGTGPARAKGGVYRWEKKNGTTADLVDQDAYIAID